MSGGKQSVCRDCGEAILWTRTRKGKKMCVDPEPVTRTTAGPDALLFALSEEDHNDGPLATLSRQPSGYITHRKGIIYLTSPGE